MNRRCSPNPLVSVVLPMYNSHVGYLREAIESILNQSLSDLELIIVDDGSTEKGCVDVAREYGHSDKRVKLFIHDKNRGLATSRTTGIKHCSSELIAFMDDDDISLEDRLERQANVINEGGNYSAVVCHFSTIDEKSNVIQHKGAFPKVDTISPSTSLDHMASIPLILNPTSMFYAHAIRSVGGCRSQFIVAEDFDLTLRFSEKHTIGNCSLPLYLYRMQRSGKLSQNPMIWRYHLAAVISASYRRKQLDDPADSMDIDDIIFKTRHLTSKCIQELAIYVTRRAKSLLRRGEQKEYALMYRWLEHLKDGNPGDKDYIIGMLHRLRYWWPLRYGRPDYFWLTMQSQHAT